MSKLRYSFPHDGVILSKAAGQVKGGKLLIDPIANALPDRPYINATYNQTYFEFNRINEQILRFAGEGAFADRVTTIHWGSGVFICVQIPTSRRSYYERYPLPLVTLADYADFTNSDMVLVDNYLAGKQVAKHLIDCGCKSFAYVTAENYVEFDRRLEGYRDYLTASGFSLNDERIGVTSSTDKEAQSRTLSWFVNNMLNEVAASKAYSIMLDYVNDPKHKTGVYEVPFALTIRETTKKGADEG